MFAISSLGVVPYVLGRKLGGEITEEGVEHLNRGLLAVGPMLDGFTQRLAV
jgi:hypothetical protein